MWFVCMGWETDADALLLKGFGDLLFKRVVPGFGDWDYYALDNTRYHLFRNPNHQAASWMEQLGCGIKGHSLTNDFMIEKTEGLKEDTNNDKR